MDEDKSFTVFEKPSGETKFLATFDTGGGGEFGEAAGEPIEIEDILRLVYNVNFGYIVYFENGGLATYPSWSIRKIRIDPIAKRD